MEAQQTAGLYPFPRPAPSLHLGLKPPQAGFDPQQSHSRGDLKQVNRPLRTSVSSLFKSVNKKGATDWPVRLGEVSPAGPADSETESHHMGVLNTKSLTNSGS